MSVCGASLTREIGVPGSFAHPALLATIPVGNVPEVNGLWAVEMPEFVPTCAELLAIAEHWARVAIERTYVEWANATNTDDWRRIYFAWRRVYRVRARIGEVVDGVIDNKI